MEEQIQKEAEQPREKLDLALKEGQTIKVNINIPRKGGRERSKSPGGAGAGLPRPPPPSAMTSAMEEAGIAVTKPKVAAPPTKHQANSNPNWIQF